jgi:hypothetical protein
MLRPLYVQVCVCDKAWMTGRVRERGRETGGVADLLGVGRPRWIATHTSNRLQRGSLVEFFRNLGYAARWRHGLLPREAEVRPQMLDDCEGTPILQFAHRDRNCSAEVMFSNPQRPLTLD